MSVISYKVGGVNLSDICNTANHSYYGDITTNYKQGGSDVGTILSLQTFSPVTLPQTITPCGYTAPINQYNTGLNSNSATYSDGITPTSGVWNSVSMSTTGQYAVACTRDSNGLIYYSNDYGNKWNVSNSTPGTWYSVSISSSGDYAIGCIGGGGKIYHSNNQGQSWTVSNSIPGNWYSLSISSSGQYAIASINGGTGGLIYYSSDYGVNWTVSNSNSSNWISVSISSSGQYAFACIYDITQTVNNGIYYSNDYGHTWTLSNNVSTTWYSVSISSSGQYAVGCVRNGKIYYTNDYGQTWNIASLSTGGPAGNANWYSVSISSTGQYALACAPGVVMYYSITYGEIWIPTTNFLANWSSVSISGNGQYALSCGSASDGRIYYSYNDSTTYVNKDLTAVFEPLYKYKTWDVTGSNAGDWAGVSISDSGQFAVATNNASKIYWSNDSGLTWNPSNTADNNWNGISISSNGQYAVAAAGIQPDFIYYSSDNGQTWLPATVFGQVQFMSIESISISGNGQYGIAGNKNIGKIYYTNDKGQNWGPASSIVTDWYSVSMSDTGQYALACSQVDSMQIYWSDNYGLNWYGPATFVGGTPLIENWESISISSSGQYAFACSGGVGGI